MSEPTSPPASDSTPLPKDDKLPISAASVAAACVAIVNLLTKDAEARTIAGIVAPYLGVFLYWFGQKLFLEFMNDWLEDWRKSAKEARRIKQYQRAVKPIIKRLQAENQLALTDAATRERNNAEIRRLHKSIEELSLKQFEIVN